MNRLSAHINLMLFDALGEKPFKCNHCEYATAQNSTLKIHLKRHHGKLLLECSLCGMTFPEKTQLNNHKKLHGGLQPAGDLLSHIGDEQSSIGHPAAVGT